MAPGTPNLPSSTAPDVGGLPYGLAGFAVGLAVFLFCLEMCFRGRDMYLARGQGKAGMVQAFYGKGYNDDDDAILLDVSSPHRWRAQDAPTAPAASPPRIVELASPDPSNHMSGASRSHKWRERGRSPRKLAPTRGPRTPMWVHDKPMPGNRYLGLV